jgi:hypothetical protein
VIPLTVVISLTAIYALYIRTAEYGLSISRFWAWVVAATALIYAVGYTVAAVRKGVWFGGIAQINVVASLALIVTLTLTLTPILSPYRLAANSQYTMVLDGRFKEAGTANSSDVAYAFYGIGHVGPFFYLKFNTGAYGRHKLEELAQLQNHPDAENIRSLAADTIKSKNPADFLGSEARATTTVSQMILYPTGRTLDAELAQRIVSDLDDPKGKIHWMLSGVSQLRGSQLIGIFVNLGADGADAEQFVLLRQLPEAVSDGVIYQKESGNWRSVGNIADVDPMAVQKNDVLSSLSRGDVSARLPPWKELRIGSHRFRVTDTSGAP